MQKPQLCRILVPFPLGKSCHEVGAIFMIVSLINMVFVTSG
jgi:hypothetical protein